MRGRAVGAFQSCQHLRAVGYRTPGFPQRPRCDMAGVQMTGGSEPWLSGLSPIAVLESSGAGRPHVGAPPEAGEELRVGAQAHAYGLALGVARHHLAGDGVGAGGPALKLLPPEPLAEREGR